MRTIFTLLDIVMAETRLALSLKSFMLMFLAVAEVIGLVILFPFLALLTDSKYAEKNEYIYYFQQQFSMDHQSLVIFTGLLVIIYLITVNFFKSWIYFKINYYVESFRANLSTLLFKSYLKNEYEFFILNSSSKLTKYLLSEIDTIVNGLMRRVVLMVSHMFTLIAILLYLFYLDAFTAIVAILILSLFYFPLYFLLRKGLSLLGLERLIANEKRFQAASETFRGIKDVILNSLQSYYLQRFSSNVINYSQNIAKTQLYNILPNFLVEALLFSLVIGFLIFSTVYLSFGPDNIGTGIPYVGVFFMALYKLKPAFQNILGGFSAIRVNLHSMENMLVELKSDFSALPEQKSLLIETFPIVCKDVSYKYESRSENALSDINLEILSSQSIAIIGKTGSGKSTFLDLFCGLLSPSCGGFSINHVDLNATNVNSFRSIVSYLPQSVFIAESTVTENIALGFDPQDLDLASVKRCAEQACIYDFIVNDLPDGFDTFLGENGCQLSGGQRQRIGLARALYRKPKILILDEGTSALDSHTENLVLKALINSSIEVVINVTHRLDTLDFFDRVLFFSDGRLIIDCDAKDFDKSSFSS